MQTKTIGFVLIAIGLVMMLYTGFNYVTTKKVVDLGALQINEKENHSVEWPPIVGALLLVSGAAIVIANKRK